MRHYKVIGSDRDDDWLEKRAKYITASAVATLVGDNKWGTLEELQAEKATGIPHEIPDTANMWHGRYDEEHNMKKFCHSLGLRSKPCHLMLESTRAERLSCTLDGLVLDGGELPEDALLISKDAGEWLPALKARIAEQTSVGLLEMKQTEAWWHKQWKEVPPRHYWWQVQTQLLVTGAPWAVLACQIGAAMFRAYFVEPDKEAHERIINVTKEFWHEVAMEQI